jgi:hypothetical protein
VKPKERELIYRALEVYETRPETFVIALALAVCPGWHLQVGLL